MFSKILLWYLSALEVIFFNFQFNFPLSLCFYFCKLSFYFPCSLFKTLLEVRFVRAFCVFLFLFFFLTQCYPVPESPLVPYAEREMAKSSVPGAAPGECFGLSWAGCALGVGWRLGGWGCGGRVITESGLQMLAWHGLGAKIGEIRGFQETSWPKSELSSWKVM